MKKYLVTILFLSTIAPLAHAYTIGYGVAPSIATQIKQDMYGLSDVDYTFTTSNGPFSEMGGILCDGVTWVHDKVIMVNAYESKANFDFTVLYEYNHALRNDADEPSSLAFATKMMAARGEAVTPWTVTPQQQEIEDSWNSGKTK